MLRYLRGESNQWLIGVLGTSRGDILAPLPQSFLLSQATKGSRWLIPRRPRIAYGLISTSGVLDVACHQVATGGTLGRYPIAHFEYHMRQERTVLMVLFLPQENGLPNRDFPFW